MSTTSSASGRPAGEIRVRFAPSPTGYLHVGGARTALFNWLFARGCGGMMVLRIEDTDIERNRPELVEGILDGLRWLGVDWDEGPYFQSQRLELHRGAAFKLAASGAAYFCDCPPEKYAGGDAVEETEDAKKEQGPRRITRCACRESKAGLSSENAAIRFRVPLGAVPPIFAHVPLILGPDRTRLSKRHGATSVGSYRDEGFLPEAFRNFLALLGWSPGEDAQFLRTPEIVARFSLEGVSRTNAVFDRAKLEWFNTEYLQKLPIDDLLPAVQAELERAEIWQPEWAGAKREWFSKTVDLLRPRTRLLPDFSTWARAFFSDSFDYNPQAREKFWKDERLGAMLGKLAERLGALPDWNHDACDHALRELAAVEGVKAGILINGTRVAIVGQAVAPPLFETMLVIGQERVVARLRRAVEAFPAR